MQDIQMVNIKKESIIITTDYVHNQMDYFDPVFQSTDPEDIPEFRNIYFERLSVVRGLEGHPETVHDVCFRDCQVGSV